MSYDKKSFLAGVALGRQLKGQATGGSGGGPTPPTPISDIYTVVEYIESSGQCYINTQYIVNSAAVIVADVMLMTSSNTWPCAFGMRDSNNQDTSVAFFYQWTTPGDICVRWVSENTLVHYTSLVTNKRTTLQQTKDGITISRDGQTLAMTAYASAAGSSISPAALWIFNLNTSGNTQWASGTWAKGHIYSFTIYEDSNLVRKFVPVLALGTTAGLYDTVTQTFYRSASGVDFTAGPVVAGG